LRSQKTDTQASARKDIDKVKYFGISLIRLPFPALLLYQTFYASFTRRLESRTRMAGRSGDLPGDSENFRQAEVGRQIGAPTA
jgi:hypothetical protein